MLAPASMGTVARVAFCVAVAAVACLSAPMFSPAAPAAPRLWSSFISSGEFWLACFAVFGTVGAVLRIREVHHRRREVALRLAVRRQTQELESERLRERERNRILEMLVSNEPLGAVLDAVVNMIRVKAPGAACAILLNRSSDACRVAAAAGFPREWLAALRAAYAVPFEVWRKPQRHEVVSQSPAWVNFRRQLKEAAPPGTILSWPIGSPDAPLGALLLCYREGERPGDQDGDSAEVGERVARLAIEHGRLYDDLHFQAHHDSLTTLPNRILFEDRLARSLREAAALGQSLAVFYVDIDRFKQINDTLTHRIGDLVLCEIADRMRKTLRPADTLARIGGDEFNAVIPDIRDPAEAEEIAGRLLEAIGRPFVVEGNQLVLGASVGIALYPVDGTDMDQLQRAADAAMYCAKDLGRNRFQAFSTRNERLDRARMDEELRGALRNHYFVVHYQPKVAKDARIVGFEALVRMQHPVHGLIPPAGFIPSSEVSGLIVPIGAWVLDEVCRQIADWQSRGLSVVPIAVNVSPVQICRSDFAALVEKCLTRHGVAPGMIELELTESLMLTGTEEVQRQMRALRTLGVHLSIDDFGSGYSSLSYLHRLQVDSIKLDKSFVQSIDTNHVARSLVQAMMGVAHGLGLNVVAEGVETEAQRDFLLASGCSLMQGFLFARPQPAREAEALLRDGIAPRSALGSGDLLLLTASMQSQPAPNPVHA